MSAPAANKWAVPGCVESVVTTHGDILYRTITAEVRKTMRTLTEDLKRELAAQPGSPQDADDSPQLLLPGGVPSPRSPRQSRDVSFTHSTGLPRNGIDDLIGPGLAVQSLGLTGFRDDEKLAARDSEKKPTALATPTSNFVSVTPTPTDRFMSRHANASMLFGPIGYEEDQGGGKKSRVFLDKTDFIMKVQQALIVHPYDVADFYWEDGISQRIARSSLFEKLTLFVIAVNSIWIAVDVDHNPSGLLYEAPTIFQLMENFFCIFFVFEWTVRFLAFRNKRDCMKDNWFVFDTVMMLLIVLDTWIVNGLLKLLASESGPDTSVFKLFRLLRLTRTARMAKLLHALPELMIMVKGLMQATRSVFSTLLLLMIIIYIFAIGFRQITDGLAVGRQYFDTVPDAMVSLLLYGALPDVATFTVDLGREHILIGCLGLFYVLVAGLTLLNMLVGVLVQVVLEVAEVEKEHQTATFVKSSLNFLLKTGDDDHDGRISAEEFDHLVLNPQAIRTLSQVGVDVVGLASLRDFIFSVQDNMPFDDFFTLVLQLRGSNNATVKDIVDMRRFVVQELECVTRNMEDNNDRILRHLDGNKARSARSRSIPYGTEQRANSTTEASDFTP